MQKNPLKNKRIFIGFNSAGSSGILSFTRVLKRRGYQIDFYGFNHEKFGVPVDKLLKVSPNRFKAFFERVYYFFKILHKYDIWHLNCMESFFFYPLCLLVLKIFNKKIISTFRGSDVRNNFDFISYSLMSKSKKPWPLYYENLYINENWIKSLQRKIRAMIFIYFSDKIILTGPFTVSSVSHFDEIIPYARSFKELSNKSSNEKKEKNKITILHAPTTDEIKGTSYIIESWEKLKNKFPNVELKVVKGLSHADLIEEMSKADIVVDQLLAGWYGGMAVEAMMMGKVVLSYINPSYLNFVSFSQEIPIFNTNIWSFKKDLENLIKVYPHIKDDIALKSRKFAKKYHDEEKIATKYLKIYRSVL